MFAPGIVSEEKIKSSKCLFFPQVLGKTKHEDEECSLKWVLVVCWGS